MKKPNQHLDHIVRNLNMLTDEIEKAYRIEQDAKGFYIKRVFNEKYTLIIRSKWRFKSKIHISLYKNGKQIDKVQIKIRATDTYIIDRKIKDLETLVTLNWDGSYRDQVNDLKYGEFCWYNY